MIFFLLYWITSRFDITTSCLLLYNTTLRWSANGWVLSKGYVNIVNYILGGIWSLLLALPAQSCLDLAWNIIVNGRNSFRLITDDSLLAMYVISHMLVKSRMLKLFSPFLQFSPLFTFCIHPCTYSFGNEFPFSILISSFFRFLNISVTVFD